MIAFFHLTGLHTVSQRYDIDMSMEIPVVRVRAVCDRDLEDVSDQMRDTTKWKVSDATDPSLSPNTRNLAQSALRKQRERLRFKQYKVAVEE